MKKNDFRGNKVAYTVSIREDFVIHDPEKTKAILDRVSRIISNSYRRVQQEG